MDGKKRRTDDKFSTAYEQNDTNSRKFGALTMNQREPAEREECKKAIKVRAGAISVCFTDDIKNCFIIEPECVEGGGGKSEKLSTL